MPSANPDMKKILSQSLILVGSFLAIWLILSHIPFTEYFKVKAMSRSAEEKLGNVVIDYLAKTDKEVTSDSTLRILNKMKGRICRYNGIDSTSIRLHIFENDEVNAFALPAKRLVFYTGIIQDANNPEELTAVMAHEIAHMEKMHVSKKLTKELGLSMLMILASGDAGMQIVKELVKIISSTSFDREMEREADRLAVQYLQNAHVDPGHFSDFLFRLSNNKPDLPGQFEWISTHPDTKERVAAIIRLGKGHPVQSFPVVTEEEWRQLKQKPIQ
jgi:predicted Zn-dependent protease